MLKRTFKCISVSVLANMWSLLFFSSPQAGSKQQRRKMQMAFDGVPGALLKEDPDASAEAVAKREALAARNADVGHNTDASRRARFEAKNKRMQERVKAHQARTHGH